MPHVMPPPPLVLSALSCLMSADASPPVCLLYASPPICLLFASWLSHCPCCRAAADSTLQLCLNLFFAMWLSQLAMPNLKRRHRLSSSSRLCLVMRRLRLSTHRRLITGCVVARRRCTGVFAVIAILIVALGDCRPCCSSLSWCRHCHRRTLLLSSLLYPVAPSPS